MEALTVTFPAISHEIIADLAETEAILASTEEDFIRALQTKYGTLARQNGHVKISRYRVGDSNYSAEGSTWLLKDGEKVKGLLAFDGFDSKHDDQNCGSEVGSNLYLTDSGWVEITRVGRWSNWQGSPYYWSCDGNFADGREFDADGGDIRWLSDEEVARQYNVREVAEQLGKTLTELAGKLSERLKRKRALAESLATIAAQLLA